MTNVPTTEGRPFLILDNVRHYAGPGPRAEQRIGGGEVGHADLPIDPGILEGLILVLDQPLGLLAVLGPKARAGAGLGVLAVERAVPVAQHDDSISLFHTCFQGPRSAIPYKQGYGGIAPVFRRFPANACF